MTSFVYRLFDADSVLLYVGCTDNVDSRMRAHATTKTWWSTVASKTVTEYETRSLALVAERAAITTECPRYNNETRSSTTDPLGLHIKRCRDRRGLSQERLARLLGVSLRTVIRFEDGGSSYMTLNQIQTVADALNVRLYELIGAAA